MDKSTPAVWRSRDGTEVVIGTRTWDGIDQPDYQMVVQMNPSYARHIARELMRVAESIDQRFAKQALNEEIARMTRETAEKAKGEALSTDERR